MKRTQTILVINRSILEKEKDSLNPNITMFVRQTGMGAFLLREIKVLSTQIWRLYHIYSQSSRF